MKKDWFVLHALTGQENKVQKSILARTKLEDMGEYIGDCIIPTERVTEKKDGKTRTYKKKFFPGYVLVQLALYDEARGIDPATGRPVTHNLLSATVIAGDSTTADAYATWLMVIGEERARELLAVRPDIEALLVYDKDGQMCVFQTNNINTTDIQ